MKKFRNACRIALTVLSHRPESVAKKLNLRIMVEVQLRDLCLTIKNPHP